MSYYSVMILVVIFSQPLDEESW